MAKIYRVGIMNHGEIFPKTKLICCDVDSTLVDDDKKLSLANIEAVRKAVNEEGIHFTIISGRNVPSVKNYMKHLGIEGVIPSLGGCYMEDWEGKIIEEHNIDGALAFKINALAKENGCLCFVYYHKDWYIEPGHKEIENLEETLTGTTGIVTNLDDLFTKVSPNKLLGVSSDTNKVKNLRDLIVEKFTREVDCFLSSPYYLEIVPKGVDKGTAVNAVCRYYGIKNEEVLAIGDYYNDIGMFKNVGISVTVENAPDDIKAVAKFITNNDCNNSAVAEAIERFVVR